VCADVMCASWHSISSSFVKSDNRLIVNTAAYIRESRIMAENSTVDRDYCQPLLSVCLEKAMGGWGLTIPLSLPVHSLAHQETAVV